jgi:hypothetical protein
MNMVSLLSLGLILGNSVMGHTAGFGVTGLIVVLLCAAAIGWAVWQSKRTADEGDQ